MEDRTKEIHPQFKKSAHAYLRENANFLCLLKKKKY